jgi:hypothetical protein
VDLREPILDYLRKEQRMLRKIALFPMLLVVSSLAGAQPPDSVWAGTWSLNVAQSKLHQPAAKQETAVIPVAPSGSTHIVKYTITGTAADGSPINLSFDGAADGKQYSVMSGAQEFAKAAYQRQSSHHYTAMFTYPNGRKASNTYVMASNGKRFTVQSHVTAPTGNYDESSVWDKQ